ncbi:MAG: efflux RND transporter periplasmic adaptor subunit [Rhodospirillaceae bacterium]|jgi:membrane fusion protein (multidrug efflux system)|nr:efflux RND transporter periplasmic adaptor subunit [Rhodospirillaceae bacterium]
MNCPHFCFWMAFVLVLVGCDQGQKKAVAPTVPIEVGIVTLVTEQVTISKELPGRITPYRVADVRPQASGIIIRRLFTEGSEVKARQQLYQIDDSSYKNSYDIAKASLVKAESRLKNAKILADRYKSLIAVNAVSKQENDNAIMSVQQANADVITGNATVDGARLKLEDTKVLSPISGRVGRSTVTEGALVTDKQPSALVTIQELDPIYVDVVRSSIEMLRLQREFLDGNLKKVGDGQALVHLILEDGSEYNETGKLLFSEAVVDPSTGSVTLRAIFPNKKRLLLPGMFVHARIEEKINEQAVLIPQQGVSRLENGDPSALVVGDDNKVVLRKLKIDRAIGDKWLVIDGVGAGDRVIVEGLQKVRPGSLVRPVSASNISSVR